MFKLVPTTFVSDCNGNNIEDSCELAAGIAPDVNGNGIIDSCECTPPIVYCSPKFNSEFCLPFISSTGVASATAGSGFVATGLSSVFGEHIPAWFWIVATAAIFATLWLNLKGKLETKKTLWLLLAEMLLVGGLAFLGGQLMHFGWAAFHLISITLQAFIFMMLTIVYLSMASEHH